MGLRALSRGFSGNLAVSLLQETRLPAAIDFCLFFEKTAKNPDSLFAVTRSHVVVFNTERMHRKPVVGSVADSFLFFASAYNLYDVFGWQSLCWFAVAFFMHELAGDRFKIFTRPAAHDRRCFRDRSVMINFFKGAALICSCLNGRGRLLFLAAECSCQCKQHKQGSFTYHGCEIRL